MENKKEFVAKYLKPLLIAALGDVSDVYYERRGYADVGEEYVVIVHKDGCVRNKCVTCDSLIALTRDALKGF